MRHWTLPPRRAHVLSDTELLLIYEQMGGPAASIRIATLKQAIARKRTTLEALECEIDELRADERRNARQ